MGIPGLISNLRRLAVPSQLQGATVVIDGPALVHRIWERCVSFRPHGSSFLCQPSYATLGSAVIAWLDALRSHDVHVRKVYFDGFLPPAKWSVRRQRLILQTTRMREGFTKHRGGVAAPPEFDFDGLHVDVSFALDFNKKGLDSLIKPPFLVPAAVDALRSSQVWSSCIEVVPGEADDFCADDVRRHGGVVMTTDSDFLVQDLGADGSVTFFTDVELQTSLDGEVLTMLKYAPQDIVSRLEDLPAEDGLSRLAFEHIRGRKPRLEAYVKAAQEQLSSKQAAAYENFLADHKLREHVSKDHPVVPLLSSLDPRISEVAIQSLISSALVIKKGAKTPRGPEEISMFLPVMWEDSGRKSSWEVSTELRRLAYGIAMLPVEENEKRTTLIEYRTLVTEMGGRRLIIPSATDVAEGCAQLLTTIEGLKELLSSPSHLWLAFAIYLEINLAHSESKNPLALAVAEEAKRRGEKTTHYSWNTIQFMSQIQATHYSLRMMQQLLLVTDCLMEEMPTPLAQLKAALADFPLIADYPTIESKGVLSTIGSSDLLDKIYEYSGIPKPLPPGFSRKPAKAKKGKRKPSPSKKPTTKLQTNPYAMLSTNSSD